MAIDAASYDIAHPGVKPANRLAEFGFVAFLLLIFVSLSPFAVRDPSVLAAGESGFGGAGDALRQVCFGGVFAIVALAALRERGLRAFSIISVTLFLLLAWCALSAAWSAEAGVTLRRAVLAIVIVLSAMLSVSSLGTGRTLQLWRYVLAGVLIVNWISIPLVHQAIHLPGEFDPALVGNWRGLYFHKNIAGAVTAITAIVFFFSFLDTRRIGDALLFLAAVGFTVMTHSKSSMGILPLAIGMGLIYRVFWRNGLDRLIVTLAAVLAVLAIAIFLALDWDAVAHVLQDPQEFTGRSAIWQGEIAFIRDHPWYGAGFGSFADTGALSPLFAYVGANWVQNAAHGHNAYLQIFVTVGGVGFALALLSFVIGPAISFWRADPSWIALTSMLFAIFVFMLLHNFLESDFLEGDSPAWVAFLLMLGLLRLTRDGSTERAP